jgi:hypothetical protein
MEKKMNDFNADNINIINNIKKSAKQSERQLTTRNAKSTYKLKCKKHYLFIFLSVTLLLNTYFVKLLGKTFCFFLIQDVFSFCLNFSVLNLFSFSRYLIRHQVKKYTGH